MITKKKTLDFALVYFNSTTKKVLNICTYTGNTIFRHELCDISTTTSPGSCTGWFCSVVALIKAG